MKGRDLSPIMPWIDGNSCQLLTEDKKTFACEGEVDHFEIVRDANGAVTHILNTGVDIGVRVGK